VNVLVGPVPKCCPQEFNTKTAEEKTLKVVMAFLIHSWKATIAGQ
jgi:hypothetical protein